MSPTICVMTLATARLKPMLTVALPNFGSYFPGLPWTKFVDLARMADDAGVDRIVLAEHVVMGGNPAIHGATSSCRPMCQTWNR
jgi:alkanesulfonate monooxygenase SsuD/methylene tetrahydromethanopterin reductase-like flavin-dependent oxidoreductase (luciferase family)